MKLDATFFSSAAGQLVLAGAVALLGGAAIVWQHRQGQPLRLPGAKPSAPFSLPRTFMRDGARFVPKSGAQSTVPSEAPSPTIDVSHHESVAKSEITGNVLPITLFAAKGESAAVRLAAPYGRMIPCETVITLESNHLETPVVGLVTEDVWHGGRLIIPRHTEVHGRALLDRTRERIAAAGAWTLVWRTNDADNGTELKVQGLALDREIDSETGQWGEHDGSAGLRGDVLRTADNRELKLFAATFLSTATTALQDIRSGVGLLGETALPAITARNASLAGTAAVLREYAQQIREAIVRDGFYLRVASGTKFYLYVTQTLDRGQAKRNAGPTSS